MEASTSTPAATAADAAAPEPPNAMVPAAPPEVEAPEVVDAEPVPEIELDLDAFNTANTRLGGRKFLAKEPSIATQKATIRAATEEDDSDEAAAASDDKTIEDALQTLKSLDSIYPQIREVLFHADGDEAGRPPSREFVEEHLRLSTFRALFRHLLGTRVEGNDA
jgi:hypothetical protein